MDKLPKLDNDSPIATQTEYAQNQRYPESGFFILFL